MTFLIPLWREDNDVLFEALTKKSRKTSLFHAKCQDMASFVVSDHQDLDAVSEILPVQSAKMP
jgi:hypothetical protein